MRYFIFSFGMRLDISSSFFVLKFMELLIALEIDKASGWWSLWLECDFLAVVGCS